MHYDVWLQSHDAMEQLCTDFDSALPRVGNALRDLGFEGLGDWSVAKDMREACQADDVVQKIHHVKTQVATCIAMQAALRPERDSASRSDMIAVCMARLDEMGDDVQLPLKVQLMMSSSLHKARHAGIQ